MLMAQKFNHKISFSFLYINIYLSIRDRDYFTYFLIIQYFYDTVVV